MWSFTTILISGERPTTESDGSRPQLTYTAKPSIFAQRWQDHPGESLYRALDRSSILGVITEGSSILDRAGGPSISGGLQWAFGDLSPINDGWACEIKLKGHEPGAAVSTASTPPLSW